mmetsp:Transcript_56740/g.151371  ORF Transcript_56740/g.151371 Transcript_56740/m.151371 type:complete len:101 (+) Transcript_56740:706-1008(+)
MVGACRWPTYWYCGSCLTFLLRHLSSAPAWCSRLSSGAPGVGSGPLSRPAHPPVRADTSCEHLSTLVSFQRRPLGRELRTLVWEFLVGMCDASRNLASTA